MSGWTYDKADNILTRTGYEGDVPTCTYDSATRLVGIVPYRAVDVKPSHNRIRTWSFGYEGPAALPERLVSVTNPLGQKTTYEYQIGPEQIAAGVPAAGGCRGTTLATRLGASQRSRWSW